MKYYKEVFKYAVLVLWCMMGMLAFAMNTSFDDAVKNASAAIKEGNAKKLSAIFDNSVNLSVKQDEGAFTKFQAELLLNDFFQTNKVDGLKEEQRANTSTTSFVVFSLKANAKNYRVFIKFVQANNKDFKIAEIRIE
ncbi:DUF4783 domain-containing protein [Sphingobacterium sp. DN00404]|uniref:DUF4783 domain-containing protein n=1 Tax=Sphingobacterium micropteri TaxID=2763501 RepID=A0ABR7YK11_9SPHI|nr:DUF4783 domain-containing protein [Sphingobacterium micropteri]MBD1431672.1 DUF4783 domain-containing protein [Sphingobacterium micropteri]